MRYSEAEERFLREHIGECESFTELTHRLNSEFHTDRKMERVREKCCKQMHIRIGKNISQYGRKPKEQLPIGTIRNGQNGTTYIKVMDADKSYATGYQEPWWMPLQKKIYQDAHGKIPDGYMVIFLNCDRKDFSLENLYPISRKTSIRLAQNGWYSKEPQLTLAAIRLCELQDAIHGG